jgi:hypothetical protein
MPLLAALFALFAPRAVMLGLWFFTDWFDGVFDSLLWPLLGFLFLPTSTLWYAAVAHWFGGAWTVIPVLGMGVAVLIDLSPASGRRGTY